MRVGLVDRDIGSGSVDGAHVGFLLVLEYLYFCFLFPPTPLCLVIRHGLG